MEQLSSCYFCGAALDASLEEYPVVPTSLQDDADAGGTVVLCPTCKRKLDAVVDSVLDAVAGTGGVDTASDADPGADGQGESTADDDGTGSTGGVGTGDIEQTLGDDEDVLRDVGDTDGTSAADASGMRFGDDRKAADENGRERADSSGGQSASTGDESASGGDESASSGGESADSKPEKEPKYTNARRAGYTGADDDVDDTDADTHDADDADTHDADDDGGQEAANKPDVTLTRLENTSVMRLLQNREFPVDRADFVTVASSAYEVSERDCQKVIDLAVEHDLLDDDEGQLRAGRKWT